MRAITIVLSVLVCLGGCAAVKVVPVKPGEQFDTEGVRFWAPHPYLLVTEGPPEEPARNDGEIAADRREEITKTYLIWLPNPAKEYAVQIKPGAGSNKAQIELKDGWMLVKYNQETDTKVPETIEQMTGAFKAIASVALLGPDRATPQEMEPGLYRFVFNEDGQAVALAPIIVATVDFQSFEVLRDAHGSPRLRPPQRSFTGVPIVVYVNPDVDAGATAIGHVRIDPTPERPIVVVMNHVEHPNKSGQELIYEKLQVRLVREPKLFPVGTIRGTDGGRIVTTAVTEYGVSSRPQELMIHKEPE